MNSGPTSERVYDEIKRRLLNGMFRPGERLDPAALAPQVGSSITPVRDALNLLAGQGLVDTRTSEGFHTPHIDEPSLTDLYAWNLQVLSLAIKSWHDQAREAALDEFGDDGGDDGNDFGLIATVIATRSTNVEHLRAVEALNDRLRHARRVESLAITPDDDEIDALRTAVIAHDRAALLPLLRAYHRRRMRHAAAIVRALYRA